MARTSKYWKAEKFLPSKRVIKSKKIKTGNGILTSVKADKEWRTYTLTYTTKKRKQIKRKIKLPKGTWVMIPSPTHLMPFVKSHSFTFMKIPEKRKRR